MKKLLTTTITCLLLFITIGSQAQTASLSIQGVLRTAEGDAVENGDYDLTFRLYTEPTTGNPIWEESIEDVHLKGGIYSIILGAGDTPLDAEFNQPYFLGVSVEGGVEMIPRARLTSSPYALSLIGNDNIFPNSGNVGVGSVSPQQKLTIARGDAMLGLEAEEGAGNTAIITTTANGMSFNPGGTDKDFDFEEGDVMINTGDLILESGNAHFNNGDLTLENGSFVFTNDANTPNEIAGIEIDAANGNNLIIENLIGETQIKGNTIGLKPDSDSVYIDGSLTLFPDASTDNISATMMFNSVDSSFIINNNSSNGDLIFNAQGGNVKVTSGLRVTGTVNYNLGGYRSYGYSGVTPGTHGNKIYFAGVHADKFRGTQFLVDSDKRIKKDFKRSDSNEDLKTLNRIEVTDYRHIDEVAEGGAYRKGLVAQQVEEVFPEAIKITKSYIPNIFTMSSKIEHSKEGHMITLPIPHQLNENDKVKIITDEGELKSSIKIVDKKSFVFLSKTDQIGREVFVYGKEINDFHNVDYDRVFTLNVSATQELARKVEALETTLSAVRKDKLAIQKDKNALKAEVSDLNARLEKLENLFNTTGSN